MCSLFSIYRSPIGPKAFRTLVVSFPGIPDFIRVLRSDPGIVLFVKILFGQNLPFFIVLISHPGIAIRPDNQISLHIQVFLFYQISVFILIFDNCIPFIAGNGVVLYIKISGFLDPLSNFIVIPLNATYYTTCRRGCGDCTELVKLLAASVKTAKENI